MILFSGRTEYSDRKVIILPCYSIPCLPLSNTVVVCYGRVHCTCRIQSWIPGCVLVCVTAVAPDVSPTVNYSPLQPSTSTSPFDDPLAELYSSTALYSTSTLYSPLYSYTSSTLYNPLSTAPLLERKNLTSFSHTGNRPPKRAETKLREIERRRTPAAQTAARARADGAIIRACHRATLQVTLNRPERALFHQKEGLWLH